MRDAITKSLQQVESPGGFCTRHTVPFDDLVLEVEGVGRVRFPLGPGTARALSQAGHPSRFGRRDKTLCDKSVRDSSSISRSNVAD
jgi:hypothetical protein